MSGGSVGREEDQLKQMAELSKNLKEGERLLAPSRRPDGSMRKPVRIRAGYVPQEEVAIYQSKGALWRKEMAASQEMPPGYDHASDGKPKTKAAKRNERKKEKRLQAALEKDTDSNAPAAGVRVEMTGNSDHRVESIASMTAQLDKLDVSVNGTRDSPLVVSEANPAGSAQDIDKRVRALKKKIRLAEGQQQKNGEKDLSLEQDKLTKLEGWRQELKILEESKAEPSTS